MNWAKLFGISGPLIVLIGAALLLYDVIRGPIRWWEFVHIPRVRLDDWEDSHQVLMGRHGDLPSPPYSDKEKQDLQSKEVIRYKEERKKELERIEQEDLKERLKSFKLAIIGFLLMAVGTLFQSLAAVLTKY